VLGLGLGLGLGRGLGLGLGLGSGSVKVPGDWRACACPASARQSAIASVDSVADRTSPQLVPPPRRGGQRAIRAGKRSAGRSGKDCLSAGRMGSIR